MFSPLFNLSSAFFMFSVFSSQRQQLYPFHSAINAPLFKEYQPPTEFYHSARSQIQFFRQWWQFHKSASVGRWRCRTGTGAWESTFNQQAGTSTRARARQLENAGWPQGRYYRPLVDNRPFCLNGRYSWICGRCYIKMVDISSKSLIFHQNPSYFYKIPHISQKTSFSQNMFFSGLESK